jgi:hypothetical protein
MVRGLFTLAGAAGAGLLIWIATQIGEGTLGGYWAVYGLLAGAGLAAALSQLFGGWTKWGWPRISGGVFLLGFLPVLVVAGWVLLAGQPDANWFERHTTSWSDDIGIGGLVDDLREYLALLAFGLGLVLGFTFDTSGPLPSPLRRRRAETAVQEPAYVPPESAGAPPPPAPEQGPVAAPLASGIERPAEPGDT